MKKYIPLSFCLLSFISLQELRAQRSVYAMPFENAIRLPSMESAINFEEIAATYQTVGNIYTTQITGVGEDAMEQTSTTHISDVKAVDAIRLLEFYLEDQLLDKSPPSSGMVEMSVVYFDEHSRWNPGTVVGVLTFGLALLMGVPYSTTVVDVEVEASFYNDVPALLASHRGVGRGKRMVSMYSSSGNRKAHQKALKKALQDLNAHIMQDPLLTGSLPAGTL